MGTIYITNKINNKIPISDHQILHKNLKKSPLPINTIKNTYSILSMENPH